MHEAHGHTGRKIRLVTTLCAAVFGVFAALVALRGLNHSGHVDASQIALQSDWLVGCLPFVLVLTALAVLPLLPRTEVWWESNASKLALSAAMGLITLAWIAWRVGAETAVVAAAHAAHEYLPFIVLLFSLYMISGGVRVEGRLQASTRVNCCILAIGAVLANVLGTTGASMLLIRPLLRNNAHRTHRVHTVVFFIFLVSNVGGCLLPIGDPPLFLGFLRGVPFLWTLSLWKEWLVTVALLLMIYAVMDWRLQMREPLGASGAPGGAARVHGWTCVVLLCMAVLAVAVVQPDQPIPLLGWSPPELTREAILLLLTMFSVVAEPWKSRVKHGFSAGPILEVAAIFVGIFLAMQVPLAVLSSTGASLGLDQAWKLFWCTGLLSSLLDNAPTYLVFMEVARGVTLQSDHAAHVMLADGSYIRDDLLTGVSLGAVFMGAMTYIGNGPNLMVRAIAKHEGVKMPGFGGYVLWAMALLLPVMVVVSLLFLRP